MTTFKKAVENLRPRLEELAKNEAYFGSHGLYGNEKSREKNTEISDDF